MKHFFLGSDAEAIARSTKLPVLLVHDSAGKAAKKTARRRS